MRMKLYYGILALLWLLTSCDPTPNVSYATKIGTDHAGDNIYSLTIDEHKYIRYSRCITHSGDCPKCRHTVDSIIRTAVREELTKYNAQ